FHILYFHVKFPLLFSYKIRIDELMSEEETLISFPAYSSDYIYLIETSSLIKMTSDEVAFFNFTIRWLFTGANIHFKWTTGMKSTPCWWICRTWQISFYTSAFFFTIRVRYGDSRQ